MLMRQLFDSDSSTYTYLLADENTREAVIIDPVLEQLERDVALVGELGLKLLYALDTHVHADHVTALGSLRERLGVKTVISERAGVGAADVLVKDGDLVRFGASVLEVFETPGHTNGCVSYVLGDRTMAFVGDAVLIRGCGRTDFQEGDPHRLYHSVHRLFSLPDATLLYPAHDYKGRTVTTVGEERRLNPRLGDDRTEAEFVDIMSHLALPYPRRMDSALPLNVRCGLTGSDPLLDTSWAPIEPSRAGIPEVAPEWVRAHAPELRIIDVREPDELTGPLGRIASAERVPLAHVGELAIDARPIVLVCRSGGRSGKAALQLASLGVARVASMRGGMSTWVDRCFPIVRQS